MKFWELISFFRDEESVLEGVVVQPKWKPYSDLRTQDRAVLDGEIPVELGREALALSEKRFGIDDQGWLRPTPFPESVKLSQELSALEAFDRFGGSALEEVFEFGSLKVL